MPEMQASPMAGTRCPTAAWRLASQPPGCLPSHTCDVPQLFLFRENSLASEVPADSQPRPGCLSTGATCLILSNFKFFLWR